MKTKNQKISPKTNPKRMGIKEPVNLKHKNMINSNLIFHLKINMEKIKHHGYSIEQQKWNKMVKHIQV